jgi:adenylate cyclase
MLQCPQCQTENLVTAKFCSECGCKLQVAASGSAVRKTDSAILREERRMATVLFADLVGYTSLSEKLLPEEIHELLDEIFSRFDIVIKKHGGYVERLVGDALIAVFGVPQTHEDDGARAVQSALEMKTELKKISETKQYNLAFRVGINTGEIIWGGVAGSKSTALGDTVNVAQRLQVSAGSGSIIIAKSTRQQLRGGFRLRQLPTVKLEGKEKFVQAYELISATDARQPHSTPFVGRANEIKTLHEAFEEAVLHKRPVWVTVLGEAGIGKTRLIMELKRFFYNLPQYIVVMHGHCAPQTRLPYAPIVEIIREYFHLAELGLNETAERLRKETAEYLPANSLAHHFLGFFLGIKYPDSPLDRLDSETVATTAFATFKEFIEQLGQNANALVLVIEDLYWTDPGTIEFGRYLAESDLKGPIMVLTSSRTYTNRMGRRDEAFLNRLENRTDKPLRSQEQIIPWHLIELPTLKKDKLDEFIKSFLGERAIPASLKEAIWSKTSGNPFFLEEVLKTLVEDNRSLPKTVEIPGNISQVLEARIDKLPADEKLVLQCASIMGTTFWSGALTRCLGRAVNKELIQLEEKGFIIQKPQSIFKTEQEYEIKHQSLAETAYRLLLQKDSVKFHQEIVNFLQDKKHQGEISDDLYLKLGGYHAEMARNYELAFDLYERYGDFERQRYLLVEALSFYTKALDIMGQKDFKSKILRRLVLIEKRGRIYGLLNKLYEAKEEFLRLKAEAPDWIWTTRALLGLAQLYQKQGDYDQAFRIAGEAAELTREKKNDLILGAALNIIVSSMMGKGLYEGAISITEKVRLILTTLLTNERINSSQGHEIKKELALAYNNQGLIAWYQGDYNRALKAYETSIDLLKEIEDQMGLVNTMINMGRVYQDWGKYSGAQELYEKVLKLARDMGDRRGSMAALFNLGTLHHNQGEHGPALKYYQQTFGLAQETGDPRTQAITLSHLGNLYHDQGDYGAAFKAYSESIRLQKELQNQTDLVLSQVSLGALYFERGNYDEVVKLLGEAETVARGVKAKLEIIACSNALGRLYLLFGLSDETIGYVKGNPFTKARQYARDGLKMAHYLELKSQTLEALTTMALVDIQEACNLRTKANANGVPALSADRLDEEDEGSKQLEALYRSANEYLIKGDALLPHIHRKETQIQFLLAHARYYLERLQSARLSKEENVRLVTLATETSARALNLTQELGLRRLMPEALYLHFMALTLSGDKTRAMNYLDQGRHLAEMMGLKPFLRVVSRSLTI